MNITALCFMIIMTSQTISASNFLASAFNPYKANKRKNTVELTPQEIMISRTTMFEKTIEEVTHNIARIRKVSENAIDYCEVFYTDGTTLRYTMYTHAGQERQKYYQSVMAIAQKSIYKITPESQYADGQVCYFIDTLHDHQEQIKSIFRNDPSTRDALLKQSDEILTECNCIREKLKTAHLTKEINKKS